MDDDEECELSAEELEKLMQFQEVTGVEDVSFAKMLLILHNWNVESAVQNHLSIQGSPQRSQSNSRAYFSWCYYFLSLPLNLIYSFFYTLIFPHPTRIDPLGDVIGFITDYELEYGEQHPAFYQGSYTQALSYAKSELKFLLIYLHNKDYRETSKFCREVLSDPAIIEYINSNLVFWSCSVSTSEGYRVSQALRENGYPFFAVIVLKDNRMTVVGRFEGFYNPGAFLNKLQSLISDNEVYLAVARADRQERELNAALRLEQDAAYMESLKADQEKARRRREEREAETKQKQEAKELERTIMEERENRRKLKIEWADRIPVEPDEGEEGVIHIVAKLPQGTRLNRRFYGTESLSALYYYIFCHPDSPDRFQVTTNFPRKHVPCEPVDDKSVSTTFNEFGLAQRTMLFVTDLDA
ncbi:FAS-associated factor 2-B [Armadillidium nasatum]|uniref:FAS-associated factor 2-B n=1 Tax=Armadillidium nasatum TaxID=96803 RepID=A0A5N5SLB4_9CRUS|nr:FAS-associated factor 2-B [Armadillidium nasatum]